MSFTADVSRIAKDIGETAENVGRSVFIELFSAVIRDTPVDEGRLRGNWQTTKNSPANGTLDRTSYSQTIAEVYTTVDKPAVYYLANNMPYAEKVEFGGYGAGPAHAIARTSERSATLRFLMVCSLPGVSQVSVRSTSRGLSASRPR